MIDVPNTRAAVVEAATELFAERGYQGASIRAIVARAGANLGAVSYYFGSKEDLYDAVLEQAVTPFREEIARAARTPGAPLDRIEAVVRAWFEYLAGHHHLRRLMMRQLASERPLPLSAARGAQANIEEIATLIREGQETGSIRSGDPKLLAISVAAQPLVLNLARPALRSAAKLNDADPSARHRMVENAVRFVRKGLAAPMEVGHESRPGGRLG